MKKRIVGIVCLLMFSSCKYFQGDKCNNTHSVIGIYENVYDKSAKNHLIINNDGTFEQEFTKENITKKNKGTWIKGKENCRIYFKNLKLFHQLPESNKKLFSQNGMHRSNNIVFVEDMGREFDFYRVK
jgi:hypothetical protein